MGLSAEQLRSSLDALALIEPAFATALAHAGYPEPRIRERGYATLLRTIVGQQVSYKAADAVWTKLEATLGDATDPTRIAATSDEDLPDELEATQRTSTTAAKRLKRPASPSDSSDTEPDPGPKRKAKKVRLTCL